MLIDVKFDMLGILDVVVAFLSVLVSGCVVCASCLGILDFYVELQYAYISFGLMYVHILHICWHCILL